MFSTKIFLKKKLRRARNLNIFHENRMEIDCVDLDSRDIAFSPKATYNFLGDWN